MLKSSLSFLLALATVLASTRAVWAFQAPIVIYVDMAYVGSENGTEDQPYNTLVEAIVIAQNSYSGGIIMINQNGDYVYHSFVSPVEPGAVGGGETAIVVTVHPSSPPVTQTLTSLPVTDALTSLPVTETPTSPPITDTPAGPDLSETPFANAAIYGLLAILTAGLVLAVYWYQRRFRP